MGGWVGGWGNGWTQAAPVSHLGRETVEEQHPSPQGSNVLTFVTHLDCALLGKRLANVSPPHPHHSHGLACSLAHSAASDSAPSLSSASVSQ